MKRKFKKIVAIKVVIFLLLQQTLIAGGLVVDNNAPKQNQANIETARNGVPVVNIVTPNQTGLSHNKFSDYNVNKEGLILNNSNKSQTNTQLAGYIYGNENLRNGTATTILNEVTSKNKTHLRGFTEVAGDRANVVVANPNGIYINGAGFINTYKATITTGNPNIQNGSFNGFDVKGGHIDIDGDGLNSSNVNKAELYAQTLKLNAKIYAQNLDIVTGKNSISTDGTIKNIENINDEKPILALDSSSLGGIYANKINLIGTSKGVGVNLPIEITAQDDFKLSADGKIVLDKVIAEKNIDIKSSSDSINTNIVYGNSVNMEAKDSITNEEIIVAQENIDLKAKDIINKNAIATLNKDINITAQNLTNYNTIYSNDSVNLYVEDTLLNTTNNDIVDLGNEKAIIFAVNSINIQGDKDKTQRTQNVVNDKSIIKTQNKDINIYAKRFDNLASNPNIKGKFIDGSSKSIQNGTRLNTTIIARDQAGYAYNAYQIYTDTMSYEPYEYAEVLSGNNINLDVNNVNNNYSLIFANNNMFLNIDKLSNNSVDIVKLVTTYKDIYIHKTEKKKWYKGGGTRHSSQYIGTQVYYDVNIIDQINSTIQAGNSIYGNVNKLQNGLLENKVLETSTYNPSNNYLINTAINEKSKNNQNYNLPKNKYGMFVSVDPNKNLDYLVESNPLYTNYSNFIGSSYFLEKMNYQGDRKTKRLGDAGYETKLVSDAIFRLKGQRTLNPDFQNENEQFVALMDSAVNLSGILDLELGKPLSQQQLANLTEDIVWMEEQIVDGKLVLVPVVYLAKDYEYLKGASIVAKNIDLDVKDSLNNSGTIKTNENMNISANSITNNAGVLLSKGKATLISNDDFVNKNGGSIKGSDVQIASINGSVINETYSNTNNLKFGINDFTYTNLGKTSSIEATNGNLVIQAKNDITNIGANLSAKDSLLLQTQSGDINLNAIKLEQGYNVYFKGGFDKAKDVQYQTSDINANNILMQSGNNINLEASKLNANNQINLNAQNDVNILALNSEYYRDTQTTTKGFMSKKTQRDMVYKESVNSSELNANDIVINASNNVNLEASKLKAQDNIIVNAKDGDVNIIAKEYREGELHERSKSSFGGLKKSVDIKAIDALRLNSALLETQAANVVITSGKDINILASEINSGADIQLKALENVLIASQSEYLKTREVHEKSSFNLKGLTGLLGSDENIYSKELTKNDKLSSSSVSSSLNAKKDIIVDSGSTTIIGSNLEANNIEIKADTGEINILSSQDVENSNYLNKKLGIGLISAEKGITQNFKDMFSGETKIKFEVGRLEMSEFDKSTQSVTNNSSNIKARENLVLDSLSDINVVGSNLEAKDNLVLNSQIGDINILNSIDVYNEDIKEKSFKASVSGTVQNEYVEIVSAVKSAKESAEQLKQVKDDYSNYKKEVKKLENTLSDLKQRYKNKEVGIDYEDVEDLSEFIDELKSQERFYVAAVAAATADLASKTVAIATQAAAAAASSGTWGFSAGISLDVNGNKSNTNNNSTSSNASNIVAKNIIINTDEKLSTKVNVTGSNVIADENLYVNTNNLNVKASQDMITSSNDSKSLNGSVSYTMYGGGGGTAGLGFGKSDSSSDSFLNNNSNLQSNNMYLNVKNDAIFQGANLRANDTLNLNVGNNLVLESLRDENSSSHKGFNVNVGGSSSSVNGGFSMSNGVSQSKQTVLSSITGDKVNVNVGNNTHLKGSLLASGNFTEDGNFVDNKNLNLTTNTLTFENLSNSNYSSNKSLGANANFNLGSKNDKNQDVQKGISSVGYQASNSLEVNASKTLATLGTGNVTVKDIENSDELDRLNRDTNAINKDLYSSKTGTKVDATLDTRLLTEEGREQIKKEYEDMNKNMNIIAGTLPDANSDNPIEATVGEVWNALTKYLTLGIISSNENNGGILAQIPVLTGVEDSQHKVLQIVNEQSDKYKQSKEDFIRFEDSSYYKSLSDEDKKLFGGQNLYVSKEPITVTKDTATYQNSINGMMNNVGEAIKNGLQQTGQIDIKNKSELELNVNYNPSYGFIGDLFESFVDKSGIGTTGIAKQTGGFVYDTTTARGSDGSNFAMHSQANAIVYNGVAYVQTTTGLKPISNRTDITKTFVSFGSPMNGKDMDKIIKSMGYEYSGAYTKNGDFVGEALGGNKVNNQQADILDRLNILNAGKLFTNDSPHSTYICQDFGTNVKCGYKK